MMKEQATLLSRIVKITDLLSVSGAFLLAYYMRMSWGGLDGLNYHLWIMLFVLPTWHVLLTRFGLYTSHRIISIPQLLSKMAEVHVIGGVMIAAVIYFIEPQGYSRSLFGAFIVFSFTFMSFGKIIFKLILGLLRSRGFNYRNILVIGTEEKTRKFISLAEQNADWGLNVLGVLQPQDEPAQDMVCGYKILGRLDSLLDICKTNPVDEVVFCLPRNTLVCIEDHFRDLEEMGITVRMVLDLYDVRLARRELSYFHDSLPMLTIRNKNFDAGQLLLKRCIDIVGAVIGLALTSILFPFIALALKLDSKGPLFFSQDRMGESGRVFKCWKFRSMHIDAEERKKELSHLNEMSGAIFKIKNDPRITRVGKFLRKTSLDELPQFWNVFKGEMSLVGTRPPTPDEVAHYENWHHRRISIKPGITGLWQVSGRNRIRDFDKVVSLDLRYIDNWNLGLDFKILFMTLWIVATHKGSS